MVILSESHNFFDGQICVFRSNISDPFNDWSSPQSRQGFSYRDGSVSFLTTFEAGKCLVNVELAKGNVEPNPDAIRIIEVPFIVEDADGVKIASVIDGIGQELTASIPKGVYNLRYEAFPEKGDHEFELEQIVNLLFIEIQSPGFSILRADAQIVIPKDFIVTGSPA